MMKGLTIAAVAALALGTAACHKSDSADNGSNVSASDNMLVPADENSMGDMNSSMNSGDSMGADNGAMAGNSATGNSGMSGNAM